MGGRFKREGTYVYLWLIHVDVWQKPTQYCKAIILQLKINKFFKKEKKLKHFCSKGHSRKLKDNLKNGRKYLQIIYVKSFNTQNIYRTPTFQHKDILILKWANDFSKLFSKEVIQVKN